MTIWGVIEGHDNQERLEDYRVDWQRRFREGSLDFAEYEAGIASGFHRPSKHSHILLATLVYGENDYREAEVFEMPRHITGLNVHFRTFVFRVDSTWGDTPLAYLSALRIGGISQVGV